MQIATDTISGFEYSADFLQVKPAADLIAHAGSSASATESALRRFSSEGLIHWRGVRGSGLNARRMYAPSDVAVAAILSRITSDFGLADRDALESISIGLYRLIEGRHAITRAIGDLRKDQSTVIVCQICVWGNADGERHFTVHLAAPEADARLTIEARATIVLNLRPLLAALLEWLDADEAQTPPAMPTA